jgi:phage shock protein A
MKALASIMRWFKAKDSEVSEAIEREHEVDFAKQDLEAMQKDLAQVTNGVGEVKATIAGLKRDMGDKERMAGNLEEDARALIAKGKEELASKLCQQIEPMEAEIEVYKKTIEQQEAMLHTLQEKRSKLQEAVQQAESSLRMIQTMDTVARASEKISTVKVGESASALTRFQDRQKRVQNRLDQAKAIQEMASEDKGELLQTEVEQALGRSKGASVLERLKKEK